MILLISGTTHAGKTVLAQKLLEKYQYPYLSIDHLKMGLIRSGQTELTPCSPDAELTAYLWPVVREMIKTAIENNQNMIVEGCYIPENYRDDFEPEYLEHIRYLCLIFSDFYIENHFDEIKAHASDVEQRMDDDYLTKELLLEDHHAYLKRCEAAGVPYLYVDQKYDIDAEKAAACMGL